MSALAEGSGLHLVQDGERLLAKLTPVDERTQLDPDGLKALLHEAGFGKWVVSETSMAMLLDRYADASAELEIELAKSSDATFSLEVAEDAMQVWLNVIPAYGGQPLLSDAIFMALGEAGVTYGIDPAAVNAACSLEHPSAC